MRTRSCRGPRALRRSHCLHARRVARYFAIIAILIGFPPLLAEAARSRGPMASPITASNSRHDHSYHDATGSFPQCPGLGDPSIGLERPGPPVHRAGQHLEADEPGDRGRTRAG